MAEYRQGHRDVDINTLGTSPIWSTALQAEFW